MYHLCAENSNFKEGSTLTIMIKRFTGILFEITCPREMIYKIICNLTYAKSIGFPSMAPAPYSLDCN